MRCLRAEIDLTDEEFLKFFQIVQEEAKKHNAMFFPECGEGHEGKVNNISCEDLSGWLIPNERVEEFEPLFMSWSDKVDEKQWDVYFTAEEWSVDNDGKLKINFKDLFSFVEKC